MTLLLALLLGATNPAVTQDTIASTICVRGWTRTVRPRSRYTSVLKRTQMRRAHLPGKPSDYEEDHIISLELGGAPYSPRNLTPQLWAEAHAKDKAENRLHKRVCRGEMTLAAAQAAVRANWREWAK